ncbi:MAG: LysM peptidoglycan-binding domain-containing M23 family metallopeptidase [Pseudanabaenaceae cyanobacterium]
MLKRLVLLFLCGLLLAGAINPPAPELCGTPPLSALQNHVVKVGETLETIAKQYNLTPATLMGLNPSVRSGKVQVGATLKIPPFDGVMHRFANDETYTSVAEKYRIRPDVLFEKNGCQVKPEAVFVPGAVWKLDPVAINLPPSSPTIISTAGYPLPFVVPVSSGYGWRLHPIRGVMAFHAGIDLGAPMGTPVLSSLAGTVVYAGMAGAYGNLVEINHSDRLITRYAHLSAVGVRVGQTVVQGQTIGLVGSTGLSTGPHLHFETLLPSPQGWTTVDPAIYLSRVAS